MSHRSDSRAWKLTDEDPEIVMRAALEILRGEVHLELHPGDGEFVAAQIDDLAERLAAFIHAAYDPIPPEFP